MWLKYMLRFGDPHWDWQPSACAAAGQSGAAFTHTSVVAGSTPARVVYVTELRARIDGLRSRLGLGGFRWTDDPIRVGVTPIKAAHMTEMRTALRAAYVAAGRTVMPTYTDSAIVAGVTQIKAAHVTELRAAVVTLEE